METPEPIAKFVTVDVTNIRVKLSLYSMNYDSTVRRSLALSKANTLAAAVAAAAC